MWDRVPWDVSDMGHASQGVNVLFMDGHVGFYDYAHDNPRHIFPTTRVSGETFGSVFPKLSTDCAATSLPALPQVN